MSVNTMSAPMIQRGYGVQLPDLRPAPSQLQPCVRNADTSFGVRKPHKLGSSGGEVDLDRAVISKLPPGHKILFIESVGERPWVAKVKITVQMPNGTTAEFFKKGAAGAIGEEMMKGTFEAETALHTFIPDRVPRPIAWGTHADDADTHFYMSGFIEMYEDLPSASGWARAVSTLHLNSMGNSPTGQFGFQVPTHLANVAINNTWNPSWEAFWAQQMKSLFQHEENIHETADVELEMLKTAFLDVAVPRYLRPLESDGRSIEPCVIHSNLWPGNIKPMSATDELCLFDSSAYWGHNEADLGVCRNLRYKLGPPCMEAYHELVPISEPAKDSDGRNAVYAMKYHALLSIMYSKNPSFRQILKNELADVLKTVEQPTL